MSRMQTRRRGLLGGLLAMAMILALLPAAAGAQESDGADELVGADEISVVTLVIPDQNTFTAVLDGGYDIDHNVEPLGDGYAVTGIVSGADIAALEALGVEIDVLATPDELAARHDELMAERQETLDAKAFTAQTLSLEDTDTVVVARADWYTNRTAAGTEQRILSVEAKTSDGTTPSNANPTMTVEYDAGPGTEIGDGGSFNLSPFIDANTYMYHRGTSNLIDNLGDVMPTRVRVTSANGGSAEFDVTEWLGTDFPGRAHRYFEGFLDHYPDAYELDELMDELHAQYPDLTEIIELPFLTNGYRRNAQRVLGTSNGNRVGVDSHAWGHEGGNDISIGFVDPGAADSALSVAVAGDVITVNLGTNAEGALVSTAAQVAAAINAHAGASDLILAYTYRGNAGDGVVEPAEFANLTDGLDAPDHVLREPYQVRMLRIGKHRDGSKTGVLSYSQEHAREWQTPLVTAESAQRLLHNYATDHKTKQLVDNLDMFFIFSTNPDGQLYSYYDFGSQRKNMTRYCEVGQNNDFNARNQWGVDNNRNYTQYNGEQGYTGASTSCTSGTYRGPTALSEPESANIHWVPAAFPNIRFSMNIHSSGNYFMWSPGSYIADGRISAPRPSFGTEQYFFDASSEILTEIKQHRGLSVTPARTGPIADVLYSAAGNSGDMMYYQYGLFGWNFEVGTSFQPSFAGGAGSEAYNQMMEFSNGVVELMDVALTWTRDRYAPTSWIDQPGNGTYDEPVEITFGTSEAADIYYTLDGSNPTTSSTQYENAGVREGGESLTITETTTIKWYSVDMAGNVEGKYHPSRNNPRTTTIVIND